MITIISSELNVAPNNLGKLCAMVVPIFSMFPLLIIVIWKLLSMLLIKCFNPAATSFECCTANPILLYRTFTNKLIGKSIIIKEEIMSTITASRWFHLFVLTR